MLCAMYGDWVPLTFMGKLLLPILAQQVNECERNPVVMHCTQHEPCKMAGLLLPTFVDALQLTFIT